MFPRLFMICFAAALCLSAGLLFNIQPMVGKMLLPRVGGSPAVWNVAMAFFQFALLIGYLLAHIFSKTKPITHGLLYVLCLMGAAFFLPIALPESWMPAANQPAAFSVLLVLITSVSLPFIALSLSAPTLQRLFAESRHEEAKDPYFLYVASNLGSFTGLMLYPLWLEPYYKLAEQTALWQKGFFALLALTVLALILLLNFKKAEKTPTTISEEAQAPITLKMRGQWILLALIPSSLSLGVTTHITTDIAATPMLWVVTLGLYLLTFVIAFAQKGESLRRRAILFSPWAAAIGIATFAAPLTLRWFDMLIHISVFFVVALACHSKLASLRPSAKSLTDFYFWVSVGGALGGSFNAFVAPVIFNRQLEYVLLLLAGILLSPIARQIKNQMIVAAISLVAVSLYLYDMFLKHGDITQTSNLTFAVVIIALLSMLSVIGKPLLAAIVGLAVIFLKVGTDTHTLYSDRDFFGTFSVVEGRNQDPYLEMRYLDHGTTRHGVEITSRPAGMPPVPSSYYAPDNPISLALKVYDPSTITAIGLGAGSINCYSRDGRHYTFLEIDPLAEYVAKTYFSFLTACPAPTILIGDGRLLMQQLPEAGADMIILDAFASDSIPTHIVTEEAFKLYLSRLKPEGIIAVHISSRSFKLEPMIAAIADNLGLAALMGEVLDVSITKDYVRFPTQWVILARTPAQLDKLRASGTIWRDVQKDQNIKAWTDDYSNLLSILKW